MERALTRHRPVKGRESAPSLSPIDNLHLNETLQANAALAAGAGAHPTRASRGCALSGLLDGAVIKGRRARDRIPGCRA